MALNPSFILKSIQLNALPTRHINCWVASITKIHRQVYMKKYPVLLQKPDGSTINIKYHEPIGVIRLPLNLDELSPEERKLKLLERQPVQKVVEEPELEIEDTFDETRYIKYKTVY